MHLTVVMSVFNGDRHLSDAIESILAQTHTDFTFVIVNNGSTDTTGEIVDGFAARDTRIRPIHNPKTLTYVEGRETGFRAAQTAWVALMDADDISEPRRLEKEIELIKEYGERLGAVGAWGRYISDEGKVLGNIAMEPTTSESYYRMVSANDAIVLIDPSSLIHLPTFYAVGGYRSECVPAADLDLWYRIAEHGKIILVIPEFLFRYRVHVGSESVRRTLLQRQKTHFINFNMRRRRAGKVELSWDQYLIEVWSSWRYRLPRRRRDLGMMYYKNAGFSYGENRRLRLVLYLLLAAGFAPGIVFKRLFQQLSSRRA